MAVKQDEHITRKDLEVFGAQLSRSIVDDLSEVIGNLAQSMHHELKEIRTDISDIRESLNRLTNTIDGFVKRLDDIETENTAQDAQFSRLLAWAEKVSSKTGIPLEY